MAKKKGYYLFFLFYKHISVSQLTQEGCTHEGSGPLQ